MDFRSTASAVLMAMVKVGVMRMLMPKRLMPVPMRMRLGHRSVMATPMMFVVDAPVFVFDRLVRMVMAVSFGQMSERPNAISAPAPISCSRNRLAK